MFDMLLRLETSTSKVTVVENQRKISDFLTSCKH